MRRLLTSLAEALMPNAPDAANEVGRILCQAVAADPFTVRWLQQRYYKLRSLYEKRNTSPKAEKNYTNEAKRSLDDILRQKEAGPPDDRLYVWFSLRSPDSCGSCRSRHGRIRTLRQWRIEGLPGPRVCLKSPCGCSLFPLRPGGQMPAGIIHFNDDGDMAAGIIGLRQDNSAENMQQGFALMPFWSNYGTSF